MALTKFIYPPESSGYTTEDPAEVITTKLDGGASRYRRDKIGSTSRVSVRWVFDPIQYRYFRAFYHSFLGRGSEPFLIDLVLDYAEPTEHKSYFVPGTVRLAEQKGHYYGVTAELEAYPTEVDTEVEIDYVYLINEFGDSWPYGEDQLNIIVNTMWPEVL